METLGQTTSTCPACRSLVPAKIITDGRDVFFDKFCAAHGPSRALVRGSVQQYLEAQRCVKPAWRPREFSGNTQAACPTGCGMCARHEQHLCLPIVEITSRCDLACPICLVDAGRAWDMTLADYKRLLDALIRAERQVDVLNLSGGEPLLHPELLAFVDEALSRRDVVRVSISTNGLRLPGNPGLLRELRARNVVVSLQFDGFSERAYETLRGRPLLEEKRRILDALADAGVSTSLTMTAAAGVNDDQFGGVLEYLFAHEHVVSLMIQPLAFAGRGARLAGRVRRLTIPDVIAALGAAGHRAVCASDFLPLPCSHPLCFSLAFYLMLEGGGAMSVSRLTQASILMDAVANRTIFGLDAAEHERLKELVYDLWSGPAASAPDSAAVLATLRTIVRDFGRGCFEPRTAFVRSERRVKSIFIHAFQDAETFDLARARRCCNAYPQPDGRLIPACVRNVGPHT
ncbi:MAG: radical SAM protein [Planctomycetota bacterium]|nr:radical SAM protein [Planctomycetota bacterium]